MSDRGLHVIGDEIYFDGYLVALIAEGVPASAMETFRCDMARGLLADPDNPYCETCEATLVHKTTCSAHDPDVELVKAEDAPHVYDAALDDLLSGMKPFVKGGLVRYADLSRIAQQLKEEPE